MVEMLKLLPEEMSEVLDKLFKKTWDWKKGLTVTFAKKGDLGECNNWRGITLPSIVSKHFLQGAWEQGLKNIWTRG